MKKLAVVLMIVAISSMAMAAYTIDGGAGPTNPTYFNGTADAYDTGWSNVTINGGTVVTTTSTATQQHYIFPGQSLNVDGAGSQLINASPIALYKQDFGGAEAADNLSINVTNGAELIIKSALIADSYNSAGSAVINVDNASMTIQAWVRLNDSDHNVNYRYTNSQVNLNIVNLGTVSIEKEIDVSDHATVKVSSGSELRIKNSITKSKFYEASSLNLAGGAKLSLYGNYLTLADFENALFHVDSNLQTLGLTDGYSLSYNAADSYTTLTVPEPATMMLLGLGGLGVIRRRRNS